MKSLDERIAALETTREELERISAQYPEGIATVEGLVETREAHARARKEWAEIIEPASEIYLEAAHIAARDSDWHHGTAYRLLAERMEISQINAQELMSQTFDEAAGEGAI